MFHTTLRRLEVFVSAVEAGGFRACSDELEISQAAVSNHVKQLETELGYPLFLRRRGAVAGVTARGVTVYRKAKELLEDATRLSALVEGRPLARRRALRIQAVPVLDSLMAERITDIVSGDFSFNVTLQQTHFEPMVEAFGRGELDIGYFYGRGVSGEMPSSLCWSEPLSICARLDHPIHRRGAVTLKEACEHGFVSPPAGTHFRRCVDAVLGEFGAADYPVALEVNNAFMAREAVIKGLGISLVIRSYLEEELARFNIAAVPIADACLTMDVRRVVRRELQFDPAVGRLMSALDREPEPTVVRAAPAPLIRAAG